MVFKIQTWGFLLLFSILNVSLSLADEDPEDIKVKVGKLAAANNHLAVRLYKQLSVGYSKNIFFSPLSLSLAFGMLFHGARKNTIKVLREALGYEAAGLSTEDVSRTFFHLLEQELPPADTKNPAYILDIANQVLVQEGLHLKHSFREEVRNLFRATVDEVDFVKKASKVIDDVNKWVEKKTHGKIKKLLTELDPAIAMLLLNAVYFKGTWETKFESKATKEQDFYNGGVKVNAKKVKFMHLTSSFKYASTDDAQVLELPYEGNNISMVILLPKQLDGLSNVEKTVTSEQIVSIRHRLYKQKVIISLPRFEVEYEKELSDDFKTLGAAEAFDATKANFSGIADEGLHISQVIHKAAIEVNEEGSEAAAATGIGMAIRIMPAPPTPSIVFNANHPFMFAIMDNRNDLILFAGRVNEL